MKKIVFVIIMFGMAAFLTGFGGKEVGGEYLGKWHSDRNITLEITRNQGESFLVKRTAANFINGQRETQKLPAVYYNSVLQVSDQNGLFFIMYDKNSQTLVDCYGEYAKEQ